MIRFDHITKQYPGTNRPAVNDIDLEILRGEFVFLVGASGSGKSSCLRLVLKEEKPTSGSIHVLGQDLRRISNRKVPYFRRNLGVVFQDFRLLPNKSVYDNVAFSLQVIGKSRGFIQEAVPDTLKMVGLAEKAQRLPHELSGGEQQRVAIARAIVNKPQILLADEPTGNLDPTTSAGIMALLERINAGGTTVVMATHEAGIVDQMQRRVIELASGQIIRDERQGGYGATSAIPVSTTSSATTSTATATSATTPPTTARAASTAFATVPQQEPATQGAKEPARHSEQERIPAPQAAEPTTPVSVLKSAAVPDESTFEAPDITPAAVPVASAAAAASDTERPAAPAFSPPMLPPQAEAPSGRRAAVSASARSTAVDTGMPVPASETDSEQGSASEEQGQAMTRPVLPVAQHDVPEQLTLAEKLGLRAPGEKPDHTGEQNVGPTR